MTFNYALTITAADNILLSAQIYSESGSCSLNLAQAGHDIPRQEVNGKQTRPESPAKFAAHLYHAPLVRTSIWKPLFTGLTGLNGFICPYHQINCEYLRQNSLCVLQPLYGGINLQQKELQQELTNAMSHTVSATPLRIVILRLLRAF